MAKRIKEEVNQKLMDVFSAEKPANPAPVGADRRYMLGLMKRGYTPQEITNIAAKAGYKLTPEFFIKKAKPNATAANKS
jgi:Holliday junction resolvasome RuvABC DNA-binding subunit